VQPSSLIFLLLIAIWAAYLLRHWVSRREHLATARSVDRFSDAMRVLERPTSLPEFDGSASRQRSYAISPVRPPRSEVVVNRAQLARPDVSKVQADDVHSTRVFRILAGVPKRLLHGLSLFASLSLVLVISPLAAFSVLPWWSVLVTVAVLMCDIAWLRHGVVSERATGRTLEPARGSAGHPVRPAAGSCAESGSPSESELEPEYELPSEPLVELEPGHSVEVLVPDAAESVESPAEADPSGWAPIPVPPPTYTLKARAPEPVTVPAEVAAPELADFWSLDGMVYDCELDELVERRGATGT